MTTRLPPPPRTSISSATPPSTTTPPAKPSTTTTTTTTTTPSTTTKSPSSPASPPPAIPRRPVPDPHHPAVADPQHPVVDPQQIALRKKITDEIISTEESYTNCLLSLRNVWLTPLEESVKIDKVPILTLDEIKIVFNNLKIFADFHQRFLADMKTCRSVVSGSNFNTFSTTTAPGSPTLGGSGPNSTPSTTPTIPNRRISVARGDVEPDCWGAVFLTFAPFLKMYIQYLNNHKTAVKFIEKTIRKKQNKKWLDFMVNGNTKCDGHQLQSLLIMPVQRVPRYKLLLEQLLKLTPKEHSDYADLSKALKEISDVAGEINSQMRDHEDQQEILRLQEQFSIGNNGLPVILIHPARKLIHSGTGIKSFEHSDKSYSFFLFNDMILIATGIVGKYKEHLQIPITAEFTYRDKVNEYKNHTEYVIEISHPAPADSSNEGPLKFEMNFPTSLEQRQWVKQFKFVKDDFGQNIESRNSHANAHVEQVNYGEWISWAVTGAAGYATSLGGFIGSTLMGYGSTTEESSEQK